MSPSAVEASHPDISAPLAPLGEQRLPGLQTLLQMQRTAGKAGNQAHRLGPPSVAGGVATLLHLFRLLKKLLKLTRAHSLIMYIFY